MKAFENMTKEQKEHHDWCEQKAREFFANKNRNKWYHTYYKDYDCDAEFDWYQLLPDSFVEDLKAAFNRFVAENNLSSIKDIEPDWRAEIIYQVNPYKYGVGNDDPYYGNPTLVDIDFDDCKCFYMVRGIRGKQRYRRFPRRETKDVGVTCIKMDDESYIQVLTELLYAPTELSFDDLYGIIPQTCELIKQACEKCGVIGDIVLQEMNNDVKTILKINGNGR